MSCGTQGPTGYAASIGKRCASAHDCAANQKCRGQVCELDHGACLTENDCGSKRCETGYCALPTPALATGESARTRTRALPSEYLAAGRDGLVDARGGLVIGLASTATVSAPDIYWGAWKLAYWRAEGSDPATWTTTRTDPNDAPERFIFVHPDGARMLVYVRPLLKQDRLEQVAPLSVHLQRIVAALEKGTSFEDALALHALGAGSYTLERTESKAGRLASLDALGFEALRNIPTGAEQLRFFVARCSFGGTEYYAVAGLAASVDGFAAHQQDFKDFLAMLRFAGVNAKLDAERK
ncbi:MAG: hypothetical protein RBU37_09845 [Myxococcota bacterium]|nr:hypothetical protein [Myxococcota bacterium]